MPEQAESPADTDQALADRIAECLNEEWLNNLAGVAVVCLSRMSRAEGLCEGRRETIDYLRERVRLLEAREQGKPIVSPDGEPSRC